MPGNRLRSTAAARMNRKRISEKDLGHFAELKDFVADTAVCGGATQITTTWLSPLCRSCKPILNTSVFRDRESINSCSRSFPEQLGT